MLKNNIKKTIIALIIFFVACTGSTVFAANEVQNLTEWLEQIEQGNGTIDGNEIAEDIEEGTNTNTNTNTGLNTNINTNTNVNENRPATTPHAGVEDYTGLIFVAIFAVSAIYAYKKVKEYNG